ncbi:Peptidyl-tRNA hydrolase [hydrothermal vent metagenome]|uniref:peptidyl-tRNA hydrolase n=1 Tax=hydrothermal vent metagenome TaxID=652676 RepID=A0A3B1CH21_9ZZZZ
MPRAKLTKKTIKKNNLKLKTIIGLGNPGKRYQLTRHNIGFIILDAFAQKHNLEFSPGKGDYYFVGGVLDTSHFNLYKPTTYMNLSGIAVKQIIENDNVEPDEILIISDDINLDTGKIRIRESGGDGGHNGLSSVIYHLNSDKFLRLRFGVGNDFEEGKMPDYVLQNFYENEWEIIRFNVNFSVSLIEQFILGGKQLMLNYFSKEQIKNKNSKL